MYPDEEPKRGLLCWLGYHHDGFHWFREGVGTKKRLCGRCWRFIAVRA